MEDLNLKRPREESIIIYSENDYPEEDSKRHKSYNHILSLLEEDEDESNQDLLDILTSLQQELSSEGSITGSGGGEDYFQSLASPEPVNDRLTGGEETERLEMMRHLLEASDDELGIPNKVESGDEGTDVGDGGDVGDTGDTGGGQLGDLVNGLWEFEDEAANYYALLQSELFL